MILKEKTQRKFVFVSGTLVVSATVVTLLALMDIGPIYLALYLVFAQSFFILGAALYLFVFFAKVLSHFGASKIKFSPGEIIFKKGDPGEFVYTIINGEVEVFDEDLDEGSRVIARLGPGEYFGEMALLSDRPRVATVKAISPVYAMTLARGDFKSLHDNLPELGNSINQIVRDRLG